MLSKYPPFKYLKIKPDRTAKREERNELDRFQSCRTRETSRRWRHPSFDRRRILCRILWRDHRRRNGRNKSSWKRRHFGIVERRVGREVDQFLKVDRFLRLRKDLFLRFRLQRFRNFDVCWLLFNVDSILFFFVQVFIETIVWCVGNVGWRRFVLF